MTQLILTLLGILEVREAIAVASSHAQQWASLFALCPMDND